MTDTLIRPTTEPRDATTCRRSGALLPASWGARRGPPLWDADGKEYLDFACGIATTVLGHGDPRVTAAVHAQLDRLWHMCNGLGYLEPVSQLADAIAAVMPAPLDTVFFGNSGTEVIEGAVKLARRATGRSWIIGFADGSTAGPTASMSLTTSNLNYRVGHGPLLPDIHLAPFPSAYRWFDDDEAAASAASHRLPRALVRHADPAAGCGRDS